MLKYIQNNKDLMTEILQYKVWKAAFEEKQLTIELHHHVLSGHHDSLNGTHI